MLLHYKIITLFIEFSFTWIMRENSWILPTLMKLEGHGCGGDRRNNRLSELVVRIGEIF